MTNTPKTEILTYFLYEDIFRDIEKNSIILPLSYLNSEENIDKLIVDLINDFNPVDAISYSSFLNMICQVLVKDELFNITKKELSESKLKSTGNIPPRLLFHRDNLLYFISLILSLGVNGNNNITDGKNLKYPQSYYKSLLLINSKLNFIKSEPKQGIMKDSFIRGYPYYYIPEMSFTIYSRRIQRYWYVYNQILYEIENTRKEKINEGLTAIESKIGISLKDYFSVITQMLIWFLGISISKEDKESKTLGFNYKNRNSFYINRSNFEKDPNFLKLIEHLSQDIDGLKKNINLERKDVIEGFFKHFQIFFDYPVLKIDKDNFCIIDLKFLLEGICSGLFWHISKVSDIDVTNLKDQYGYLMEKYFLFLLKNIFPDIKCTSENTGQPDAVLELDDIIIIFEFTTEYYRYASLYNTDNSEFKNDIYRILFNEGKKDPHGRKKKDEGKFIKLNNYMEQLKTDKKRIISVLVTENYFGDYDLLNEFDNIISINIQKNGLKNIQKHRPLIINLDDLETCWGYFKQQDSIKNFIEAVDSWNAIVEKGPYHYNFSGFISFYNEGKIENENYREFFNFNRFLDNKK